MVGADEVHAAPTLLLQAEAAVEELIVLPAVGEEEGGAGDGGGGHGGSRERGARSREPEKRSEERGA
jgi:hypothetical protein